MKLRIFSWLISNWQKLVVALIVVSACVVVFVHFKTYNEIIADRDAKITRITELNTALDQKNKEIETQKQLIEQERSLRSEITAVFRQQQQAAQTRTIIRERIVNAPTTVSEQDTPLANDPALLDAARGLRDHQKSNGNSGSESSSSN